MLTVRLRLGASGKPSVEGCKDKLAILNVEKRLLPLLSLHGLAWNSLEDQGNVITLWTGRVGSRAAILCPQGGCCLATMNPFIKQARDSMLGIGSSRSCFRLTPFPFPPHQGSVIRTSSAGLVPGPLDMENSLMRPVPSLRLVLPSSDIHGMPVVRVKC